MKKDEILSSDEVDFIQQLFAGSQQSIDEEVGGWLRVTEGAAGLLEEISGGQRIELEAGWKGHKLRFPLKSIQRPDTGEMTLELGVPEILEGGERSRSWRALPDDRILVGDPDGRVDQPRVVNLSYTGMAIEQPADQAPHPDARLRELHLVLPGETEYVRLLGYVVRHTRLDDKRVQLGIRFDLLPEDARDQLGRYILRRHKEMQATGDPAARDR